MPLHAGMALCPQVCLLSLPLVMECNVMVSAGAKARRQLTVSCAGDTDGVGKTLGL